MQSSFTVLFSDANWTSTQAIIASRTVFSHLITELLGSQRVETTMLSSNVYESLAKLYSYVTLLYGSCIVFIMFHSVSFLRPFFITIFSSSLDLWLWLWYCSAGFAGSLSPLKSNLIKFCYAILFYEFSTNQTRESSIEHVSGIQVTIAYRSIWF